MGNQYIRFIIITVLKLGKQVATYFFWPTPPRQCEESIVLVDVVSKPAQNGLELPFFIQNVVFESAEKFVMVPIGCAPIVGPSHPSDKGLKRPARV